MKNILITGACGGMGYETCKLLKSLGYNIFALDYQITPLIDGVNYIMTDVTNTESVNNAFELVKKQVEHLDAIIHFAGIYDLNSLIEINEESIKRIFDINFFGVYRINKIFFPLLKKGSRIILTSSELAPLDPLPFTGLYAITKSTIEKYAYSLRMELNLLDIKVSILRPGAIKTNLMKNSNTAIEKFTQTTKLYSYNAKMFDKVVNSVQTKNLHPNKIAQLTLKILESKHPKYVYNINRNIGLKLLNILPQRMQVYIIKKILTKK